MDPGDETQNSSSNEGRDSSQVKRYIVGAELIPQQTWKGRKLPLMNKGASGIYKKQVVASDSETQELAQIINH